MFLSCHTLRPFPFLVVEVGVLAGLVGFEFLSSSDFVNFDSEKRPLE